MYNLAKKKWNMFQLKLDIVKMIQLKVETIKIQLKLKIVKIFQLNSKIQCDFFSIFVHCGDSDLLSTHLYFEREVKNSFCFSPL